MDITSWVDAVGESIKSDQVTIAILVGISIAGYKWVSKIDAANRDDHAKLGQKVDELKDAVNKGFQDHVEKWHRHGRAASTNLRAMSTKKVAKKASKKRS